MPPQGMQTVPIQHIPDLDSPVPRPRKCQIAHRAQFDRVDVVPVASESVDAIAALHVPNLASVIP